MTVTGFGCSFIHGAEHADSHPKKHSRTTWPAVIAQRLGYNYNCLARSGCGNLSILNHILDELAKDQTDLYIVNWTWTMRWDYVFAGNNQWHSLNPNHDHPRAQYYYQNIHADYTDKLHSLIWINSAVQALTAAGKKFCMTYMDDLLFEDRWHTSPGMSALQQQVRPHLQQFDKLNFVDWSKQHDFAIGPLGHPLEAAHQAAALYLLDHSLV